MTRLHKAAGILCHALFLSMLVLTASGEERAKETKRIDLSATLKYVQDWTAREAFPDSPSFAYQNAFSHAALEGRVSDNDKSRILDFLKKCQKPDGGFVTSSNLNEDSTVIFTYFALTTLDLINASSTIDRERATGFILSLVQKDGGIKGTAKDLRANLGTTFYGIRSLYLLNALDRLDRNGSIAYIKTHRDGSKAFSVLPGGPSAPQSTFMAVDSLNLLGALTDEIKSGTIEFLKETPYASHKDTENSALMSMDDTVYVLETATILSAVSQLDTEGIFHFVESLYVPENGGFGPRPGYGSTPSSTCSAIRCLVMLGKPHQLFKQSIP